MSHSFRLDEHRYKNKMHSNNTHRIRIYKQNEKKENIINNSFTESRNHYQHAEVE